MRSLLLNAGAQVPGVVSKFEEMIGDKSPIYTKDLPPTENRTDALRVECHDLHDFGSVLMDLSEIQWEEMNSPQGQYWFGMAGKKVAVHLAGGLEPTEGLSQVKAQLRVKSAYPTNRPVGAKQPNVSYAFVLELSPSNGDFNEKLVVEKSSTGPEHTPLLDSGREIFAANWTCVKRVPVGYEPPVRKQQNDGRSGRNHHQGAFGRRGGGERWGDDR